MSKIATPVRSKAASRKASSLPKRAKTGMATSTIKGRALSGPTAFAGPESASVRTKTLRLKPAFDRGLLILKDILRKPVNTMVNEAVGEYIERRTAQVESDLTTTLDELQAYRRSDPEFAAARAAFVDAEARHGHEDPMEGRVVQVERPADAPAPQRFVSRARSEVAKAAARRPAVGARKRA